jgi:hypothetical protein
MGEDPTAAAPGSGLEELPAVTAAAEDFQPLVAT